MDLLSWMAVGFIVIGFVVLAFITRNMENEVHQSSATQSIIWKIVGTAVWGIVSIFLIVYWLFPRFL
ncbi:heme/copper-type cytochrome/quinol oxidase subunit 3 [Cytobacillus eiseniae]|uniref:Heme/copper-type cytochrome/quinol oxidase subunit 3 n=1 Tax=Cytobacillus eiseniae TaxID=762947 RepID=A0ABS4RL65_9BACI|nr:heme/copper-type cytochrome/quinol oxidase subunit 3 [Cytobacillus eiseniae]